VDFKTANQINTDGKHIKVKNVNDILMTSLKRSASQPSLLVFRYIFCLE
jgi:hypothetical protein